MKTSPLTPNHKATHLTAALGVVAFIGFSSFAFAQAVSVPNFSFEQQVAPDNPAFFYVNTNIDSWQKVAQPGYFNPGAYGFSWDQTMGVFLDSYTGNPGPLDNRDGNQCLFLQSFPGVQIFQDLTASYEVGKSYDFTLGVLGGRGGMADGTELQISLYYLDGGTPTTIASTSAVYTAAGFPSNVHLVDFTVNVPTVLGSDAWANQAIGISITNNTPIFTGNGYWDADNARLTATPEPTSLALLSLGGLLFGCRRNRRRA